MARGGLPEGYVAVAVDAAGAGGVSLCALVRRQPDPVGGQLVLLRRTFEARVFLGCLCDPAGGALLWLELWVQDVDAAASAAGAAREALTNAILDQRWQRQCEAFAEMGGPRLIRGPWETEPPPPTYIDAATLQPRHVVASAASQPYILCRDDALLARHGLPAYSNSLVRYLVSPGPGADRRFIPLTAGAPTNGDTLPLEQVTGQDAQLLPLNPAGGLMMVTRLAGLSAEAYINLLGGASWSVLQHGRTSLDLDSVATALHEQTEKNADGRLFMGRHGRWGRFVETLHLKLGLLTGMFQAVQTFTGKIQRPLLNLSPESFQISLGEPGRGLPFLWTAAPVLADPGRAIRLTVEGSDTRYYLRGGATPSSIYQPASAARAVRGAGTLRIRRVMDAGEDVIIEGTFATQQRLAPSRHDLLWLQINVGDRGVDLYAHAEEDSALAVGEWRFRTVNQRFAPAVARQVRAAEGIPLEPSGFEIIPLLSTPCDLYGLGVLAVRCLLVNGRTTLPMALDETLSLARQAAADHNGKTPLRERLQAIFRRDSRWLGVLGPQQLVEETLTPEEALDLIPGALWWSVLELVVRLFPGVGPDSYCADFGDAPAGAVQKVFQPALAHLEQLLVRTRSLIVIDWRFNREIHAVIRRYASGLSAVAPAAPKPQGSPRDMAVGKR